jgi:undecaprenyl diphosphate synthase
MPDVDLFLRPSGEQRISNFLIWQAAYAELVFQDVLFPDLDRRDLWRACEVYAARDRRFGSAIPTGSIDTRPVATGPCDTHTSRRTIR